MRMHSKRQTLNPPERLDTFFGLVAGLYVAALVSPAVLLIVAEHISPNTAVLFLGVLGTTLTAAVTWVVTRRGSLVEWLDSTWLAWLLPVVGVVPVFAYLGLVLRYIAVTVTDLPAESTVSVVGFAGFILGIAATFLGSALILMARTRLVNTSVDDDEVGVKWTAGWPHQRRFWILLSGLVIVVALAGLGSRWWQEGPKLAVSVGIPLIAVLIGLGSERTYRVTGEGLEQKLPFSRRLFHWTWFDGFRVTGDAIIIHRPFPHVDIRCSRTDIIDEEEAVVAALEEHLDRLD